MKDKIKVAVITEWHPINVINFYKLFDSFDEFECYIQALELIAEDKSNIKEYDVLVFYNLSLAQPEAETARRVFSEKYLGSTGQGIFLLHHGILNYPDWPLWNRISGLESREFKYYQDQTVQFNIADPNHPITQDLSSWTMDDETYTLNEPNEDCNVLITTEHPLSLKSIAWTRQYKKSRVFCYASGHDNLAYSNENFREVVKKGILWAANKI